MNEKNLVNRNIVIIGGTTGLGYSAARAFIASGANVVVAGRNRESAKEASKSLGNKAVSLAGDTALIISSLFYKLGADLAHVVISHTDRLNDIAYHRELLQAGISVEYDAAFRWKKEEVNVTYKLLESLLPEFPNQIVVGLYKIVAGINSTPAIPGYTRITTNLHPKKLKELKPFMNIKKSNKSLT